MDYEESCGNVFADLGLPNPEKLLERSEKMIREEQKKELEKIKEIIDFIKEEDDHLEDVIIQYKFLTSLRDQVTDMYDEESRMKFKDSQKKLIECFDNFLNDIRFMLSEDVIYLFQRKDALESVMEFYAKEDRENAESDKDV